MTRRLRYALAVAFAMLLFGAALAAVLWTQKPAPWAVVTAVLGGAVAGGCFAHLAMNHLLGPFRDAADTVRGIEESRQRLPLPKDNPELADLVGVLNDMLERLQEASERERAFLGTASHELRRPLAALRGELELAVSRPRQAGELRRAIDLALGDAEAMTRLVDDLLFQARARAGALRLREELVSVLDLVYESVDRSQRALSGQVSIVVGSLPDVEMRVDRSGLRQVLESTLR